MGAWRGYYLGRFNLPVWTPGAQPDLLPVLWGGPAPDAVYDIVLVGEVQALLPYRAPGAHCFRLCDLFQAASDD